MNVNTILWLSALSLSSAHSAIFLSRLVITFPGLRIGYFLLIAGGVWFFQSQFNQDFRQAIAKACNLSEGAYVINLYCILLGTCLLYTSPSPRDISGSRMPSSA